MKHLEDEDIARMIEGTISKKERENFLKHFSECETCLSVYSETFKFIEEEKKGKFILKFPNLKETVRRFGQAMDDIFTIKRLALAAAALVIIVLMGFVVLKKIHDMRIENAKIVCIKESVTEMEAYAFAPSEDERDAAVRAGNFVQDLSLLVNSGEEELRMKIVNILIRELKMISKNETDSLSRDLENIERKNFETVVQRIRELMEKRSLSELFQFGRFLEHSILSTFENKVPKQEDIEKYHRIVRENKFPPGVSKELKKLKKSSKNGEIREICMAIKEIFLE